MAEAAGAVINTGCSPYRDTVAAHFENNLPEYARVASEVAGKSVAIATDKLTTKLANDMLNMDLAYNEDTHGDRRVDKYFNEYDGHGWLAMPEGLAAVYMSLLAEAMSSEIGAPLISDRQDYAQIAKSFLGALSSTEAAATGGNAQIVQSLMVDFVTAESVHAASMVSILELRKDRKDEMQQFRAAVEDTVEALAKCEDVNHFEDALNEAKNNISAQVEQQERVLQDLDLEFGQNLLTIFSPSMLVALWSPPPIAIAGAAVGAGLALGLFINRFRNKVEVAARFSSFQYLLSLGDAFPATDEQ